MKFIMKKFLLSIAFLACIFWVFILIKSSEPGERGAGIMCSFPVFFVSILLFALVFQYDGIVMYSIRADRANYQVERILQGVHAQETFTLPITASSAN